MIARVRGVMSRSTSSGSTVSVSESVSAKTGTAFWYRIGMIVPRSVIALVMISSPGSGFTAPMATCRAAVPDVDPVACFAP